MKKIFYFLLIIIGILMITVFVIGKDYHYEKSITINSSADKVYRHLISAQAFNEWNPWMKVDPNVKVTYSGEPGQVGSKYCWESKKDEAGSGCQEITELVPNQKQSTKIVFMKPHEGEATSDIVLTPEGSSTKVTWSMDTEMDYPMNIMKLMMDSKMDKSYA